MTDRPQVVSADVLVGGDDEPGRPSTGRLGRLAGLALAAAAGFAASQLVAPSPSDGATGASLALVTGRQPHLEGSAYEEPPTSGLEVTLVNTGPAALRLDRAQVGTGGLAWDVDRPLEPGQQAVALLRDARPCDGPLDALTTSRDAQQVRVSARDEQSGARLPDVLLALPPAVGRLYDDHVRQTCAQPRLPDAVETLAGPVALDGADLVVPLGVVSRSVQALEVVEVATTLPGLGVQLTVDGARPVALPMALPGRARAEIAEGIAYDDPASTPYRLRITADGAASCDALLTWSGSEAVVLRYLDPQDRASVADRPVHLDLAPLVDRACRAPVGAPPR